MRKLFFTAPLFFMAIAASAQKAGDSITVSVNASYDSVTGFRRFFFGKNYRREWAQPATLPVIKISEIKGGLTVYKQGGGHQTHSLRLKDKNGKEWALRTLQKYPEVLLPQPLRETFAKDWLDDAMSAEHPYGALVVPVIAAAEDIPHSNPVIGYVATDTAFGEYAAIFEHTVCLLEEREPIGKSDNSNEMLEKLNKDNDNRFDTTIFLKARLLDLFVGDWDRHEDQWRWADTMEGKGKDYVAVPRDRDQVFHVSKGVFPTLSNRPWIAPFLHDFDGKIKNVTAFFFESRKLNARFLNQVSYERWTQVTNEFTALLTDSLLEAALRRLPFQIYNIRHDELLVKLKTRRGNLASAMDDYYRFLNKVVDIQTTDKNELVTIADTLAGSLNITIHKLSKERAIKQQLFFKTFDPAVTKEIRLFVAGGDDSVVIDNKTSGIKLRIVGGEGNKIYNVAEAKKKVKVYAKKTNSIFEGDTQRMVKRLSDDSANAAIVLTNPYNVLTPLPVAGFNLDDDFLLGSSLRYTCQGFRTKPYGSVQQFSFLYSFATSAFKIRYRGEWLNTFGKADLVLQASALAPNNNMNFYGKGNESSFTKFPGYKRYYRTRFSVYQVEPLLRWRSKTASISLGPSFQYYHSDYADNVGRFINNVSLIHSYDSSIFYREKAYVGVILTLISDRRNDILLTSSGTYGEVKVRAYRGLNSYAENYAQLSGSLAAYKSLNTAETIVISDRVGGVITTRKAPFYESGFLGGQENLLGYRQFRFAGDHTLYNNLEARLKLGELANYILPGELGLIGFYDLGRVWQQGLKSDKWHSGAGGGVYFAPARLAVFRIIAGHSSEGWYPYFTIGLRF